MSFFKKIGHTFANIGRKTGSGISQTFKKAGKGIIRGVSGLAGGMGGASLAEGLALAIAPEFVIPSMAVGAIVGRGLAQEAGGIAYKSLEKQRPQGTPAVQTNGSLRQGAFQGTGGKTDQRGRMSIPDSKYFRQPVRVGENGGGQRQTNPIEKSRPPEKKMDMFI
jgi:hypothetical protein